MVKKALPYVLAALFVGFAACSSNDNPSGPSGASVSIVVNAQLLTSTAYGAPIVVLKGTTVTWTNNDTTSHTSTADAGAWSSGTIAPGGKFSATMQTAGTFTYHCTIHPGMVGTVTVQ